MRASRPEPSSSESARWASAIRRRRRPWRARQRAPARGSRLASASGSGDAARRGNGRRARDRSLAQRGRAPAGNGHVCHGRRRPDGSMSGRAVRAAVVFLTRVPLGGFPYARSEHVWAAAYFPLVGLGLGGLLGALHHALWPLGALPDAVL